MKCPKCGTPMNHHADKLVTVSDDQGLGRTDPSFGGVIQETHTCPACANVEFRRAKDGP
jgi:ribosomal protein S27AE